MDAFESLIADLFEWQGYWVRTRYKVELSPADKRVLGAPKMPRPEIDVLAYQPGDNTLWWIECKSFLDSPGVTLRTVTQKIRVFASAQFRELVTKRLIEQLKSAGLVAPSVDVQYCLVAGHLKNADRQAVREHVEERGWVLYDEEWIRERLVDLTNLKYEDTLTVILAKLLGKGLNVR